MTLTSVILNIIVDLPIVNKKLTKNNPFGNYPKLYYIEKTFHIHHQMWVSC